MSEPIGVVVAEALMAVFVGAMSTFVFAAIATGEPSWAHMLIFVGVTGAQL